MAIHSNNVLLRPIPIVVVVAALLFLLPNEIRCDCPLFLRTAVVNSGHTQASSVPLPPNHPHHHHHHHKNPGEQQPYPNERERQRQQQKQKQRVQEPPPPNHHSNDAYTSVPPGQPSRDVLEAYGAAVQKIDWDDVRSDLRRLYRDVSRDEYWPSDYGHYGGLFVRLTWHCTGSYRLSDGRGGCDGGNQRFDPERSWADNTNLDKARTLLSPIKLKHGLGLSYGDLYVLAGTEAIHDMGGPTLGFCAGRIDTIDNSQTVWLGPTPQQEAFMPCGGEGDGDCRAPLGQNTMGLIYVNPEGPFGDPDPMGAAGTIRDVFGRMTMTDRENVALIGGGHTFGKTHGACPDGPGNAPMDDEDRPYQGMCGRTGRGDEAFTSGFEGPWTSHPTRWDNDYMRYLVDYEWEPHVGPGGHTQWRVKGGNGPVAPVAYPHNSNGTQDVMMMTTDVALAVDPAYYQYVQEFADDADAFASAFAEVWYKLTARDMGPHGRCVGPDVPPPQPFQNPLPEVVAPLADMAVVEAALWDLILSNDDNNDDDDDDEGYRGEYIRLAWQCASTFRVTDYLGGCNGARIRLSPGRDWVPNANLDRVLASLEPIKERYGDGLSWADLIVMAGNVEFMQRMAVPHTDDGATFHSLPFCPGRTDAIEDEDHGWDNLAFGNDAYPTSIELMLELNTRRGLTVREFVALSWPTHYAQLLLDRPPLSTRYLHDILMDRSGDCGGILTCGLQNHPEVRVWVEYYVTIGDRVFVQDVAAVWTKMMNIDRFDGPTGNVCDDAVTQDNLYIMQILQLGNNRLIGRESTASVTPMTTVPFHGLSLSAVVSIATQGTATATGGIIVIILALIGVASLVSVGMRFTIRFARS